MTDIEGVARHPALAEIQLQSMQSRIDAMQSFISTLFPDPMPPEDVRAALAQQPQALHFCADAI